MRGKAATAARALRAGGVAGLASVFRRKLLNLHGDSTRALRSSTRRVMEFGVRPHLLRGRVTHLYGPARVDYAPDELLVITVVRNGALYVRSFLEHYRALGVAPLCVSRQLLHRRHGRQTLRSCRCHSAPDRCAVRQIREHHEALPRGALLARTSGTSARTSTSSSTTRLARELPLAGFLQYLNERRFTAVVAQMLDMFSELPLGDVESRPDDRLMDTYTLLRHLRHRQAAVRVVGSAEAGSRHAPGRHPADRVRDEQRPHESGACAHGWQGKTLRRVASGRGRRRGGRHGCPDALPVREHLPPRRSRTRCVRDDMARPPPTSTSGYRKALARNPRLSLKGPSARRFSGLEPLIADGFLVVSDDYVRWVHDHTRDPVRQTRG